MDDHTALERQIGVVLGRMGGPEPSFDAMAIARIAATQSPKWRFQSMFSATKFVVAGVIVALFGGFLLAGLLTQPSDDVAPAAVTESPSSMTTEELLSGMVTEEVEPAVYRVDSDGIRTLSRPMGASQPSYDTIHNGMEGSIAAGLDGSVWWFAQDGFFRLGEPGVHSWPNDRENTFFYQAGLTPSSLKIELEVGPDGTVWLARHSWAGVEGEDDTSVWEDEISSFDGESWSVHQQDGETLGVEVLPNGDVWGAWVQQVSEYPWSHVTVARLGDAGWEPLSEVPGDHYADLSVAAAGGREVWLMPGVAQLLQRHDGSGWEVQTTPEAGYEMRADASPDGTLWVRLSTDCSPGGPGSGGCIGGPSDILARFDGRDWEVFDASDGIPQTGHHQSQFYGFFEAASDGSVWFDPTVPEEEYVDTDCDGVANFDGSAVTRYLRGICIYAMDVGPHGAVWVQAGHPGDDDPQPIHTFVITPEAVAE